VTRFRDLAKSVWCELPAAALGRWASVFFSLSVLTFLLSIAASQLFLALAAVVYLLHLWRDRPAVDFPPIKIPLALFCVFTVLSAWQAANPAAGGFAVRKLVLFVILLLAANLVSSGRHLKLLWLGLFLESALAGLVATGQFVVIYRHLRAAHPDRIYAYLTFERIHGFMGHWMNFGGQQMLVLAALLAFLLLAPRGRRFWWIVLAMVALSIVLNFTRGVWLGSTVAVIYLVGCWRPRLLWLLPVLLLAGYLAAPSVMKQRLRSLGKPTSDPSIAIRFEMWQAGLRMVWAHPWLGVGPGNIEQVYLLYLPPGQVPIVGYHEHLHNNLLQLGAERGLPCLGAWLWFMGALVWCNWKLRRRARQYRWMVDAALAGWLAFFVEGFFEFNFGTSPVLMLFLFMMAAPMVLPRSEGGEGEAQVLASSLPVSA
jgi:O-antigen ligase